MATTRKVQEEGIARAELHRVNLTTPIAPLPLVRSHPQWGCPDAIAPIHIEVIVKRGEIMHRYLALFHASLQALGLSRGDFDPDRGGIVLTHVRCCAKIVDTTRRTAAGGVVFLAHIKEPCVGAWGFPIVGLVEDTVEVCLRTDTSP